MKGQMLTESGTDRKMARASDFGRFAPLRPILGACLAGWVASTTGCATQGDFLRLQEKVAEHHQTRKNEPDPFARIAQLSAEVDAMRQQLTELEGELEMARKESSDALAEAQRTRMAVAQGGALGAVDAGAPGVGGEGSGSGSGAVGAVVGGGSGDEAGASAPAPDQELAGYQAALDAWRTDDFGACIERFTAFLQTYPNSGYADDAAYWLADCTYKNEDFKRAVVRFNAVVSVYPESPKAPDALYRQGESLLKLGPKFHEAARTVFRRVQKDYPNSERATEAAQQLDRLGPGAAARG
jgi:tol-pal system protein YbgF